MTPLTLDAILWDGPVEYLNCPQLCAVCSMSTVGRYCAGSLRLWHVPADVMTRLVLVAEDV